MLCRPVLSATPLGQARKQIRRWPKCHRTQGNAAVLSLLLLIKLKSPLQVVVPAAVEYFHNRTENYYFISIFFFSFLNFPLSLATLFVQKLKLKYICGNIHILIHYIETVLMRITMLILFYRSYLFRTKSVFKLFPF